jgi:DNA-binding transcriptional LysR family regulator
MRADYNALAAFAVVARARSFTRAAAEIGVSPSALSQTMRQLEDRLGYALLTRTTRSVSTTEAGERLLATLAPRLLDIDAELLALGELRERPAGLVRITCSERAAETALWPRLSEGLVDYPEVKVEIFIDHGFADIAAQRFDAGVRLGESVEKDMIAVRIGRDFRMVAVAAPAYFASHGTPRTPQDLVGHSCINLRLSSSGNLYAWEFERDGHPLRVRVDGQFTFNTIRPMLEAALAGFGIAYLPEDSAEPHLKSGALVQVLDDWCQPFSGFHLYYPSRRQMSPALALVVDLLRYRK